MCTIHQPSSSVFEGFDSVCFLTEGQMAYVGKAAAMKGYLASVGKPIGENTNPADHMLDLINKDFGGEAAVARMIRKWRKRREPLEQHSFAQRAVQAAAMTEQSEQSMAAEAHSA